jgi:2-methylcitrate dehydratase PrpD
METVGLMSQTSAPTINQKGWRTYRGTVGAKGTPVKTTERLAQFIVQHHFADVPHDVVEVAQHTITDTLGCGIAGYMMAREECAWILSLVKELGGQPEATVFLDGYRTSAPMAALANGTMIHTVDFDDTHMGAIAHFSAALVATVFALSERVRASGQDLLEAFVVGFEVGARVGRQMMPSHYRYWHPTSTFGSLAAVAAACKLLKLDQRQTEYALGLAADQAAGLRYCVDQGDYSKSLHPGFAAMRGVMLALLVQQGANGPSGILEYPTGFCQAFSENPDIAKITDGLGTSYELRSNSLKAYPTILCSHASIQAVQEAMQVHGLEESEILKIHLRISETAKGQGMNYRPTTKLAARLSIPFCVAMAAIDKQVSLQQFTHEKLKDHRIKDFMGRIEIEDDPSLNKQYPETLASIVRMETTRKGTITHEVIYPKGNIRNPLSREEVAEKFLKLSAISLPEEQCQTLLTRLFGLEKAHTVEPVIEALRSVSPQSGQRHERGAMAQQS